MGTLPLGELMCNMRAAYMGPIWFGIFIVLMVASARLTPPLLRCMAVALI